MIYTREVLDQCCKQDLNIEVPDFPILQNISDNCILTSALGILATQVPDYFDENQRKRFNQKGQIPTEVPVFSVRERVKESFKWKEKKPDTYQERINGFRDSMSEDIQRKNEYFNDCKRYRKDWIKRFLKVDRILKAFNSEIDVDSILDKIDATKCPAINLYWKVREKRMMSGNPPRDNDVDDYMFIPVVPYTDVVLTDSNLQEFILQADRSLKSKVFSKASDALKAIENYKFTY